MNKCKHEYGPVFQVKDARHILQRQKCKKCSEIREIKLDKSGVKNEQN